MALSCHRQIRLCQKYANVDNDQAVNIDEDWLLEILFLATRKIRDAIAQVKGSKSILCDRPDRTVAVVQNY